MDVKFSVVMPTLKDRRPEDRDRAMLSVKAQTIQDYELLVVDGVQGKAYARNKGMTSAKGDWICWLDDDDWYFPTYLEVIDQAIELYPDASLFTVGGLVTWKSWNASIRMPHKVDKGDVFKSGVVMAGGFVFKRSCLKQTGLLPESISPYEFGRQIREQHPEIVPLYGEQFDLGNPYGDDYAMYYKLTRHYQPIHLETVQFGVMIRGDRQLIKQDTV